MSATTELEYPFVDLVLARRLEQAEGRSCREFVETCARVSPDCGAACLEVAGADVMFDGIDSPATQTFGLGLFQDAPPGDLERIDAFYRERSAPVDHL